MSPVILDSDLLALLDVLLGLQPDVVAGVEAEPGVTNTTVVTQGKCGVHSSAIDTWKYMFRKDMEYLLQKQFLSL